jgi:hypothetical protein
MDNCQSRATPAETRLALIVKSDSTAEVVELGQDSLTVMQTAVRGLIEAVDLSDDVTMWVNEEGLYLESIINPLATLLFSELGADHPIKGDVIFTGGTDQDGETMGLGQKALDHLVGMTVKTAVLNDDQIASMLGVLEIRDREPDSGFVTEWDFTQAPEQGRSR